VVGQSIGAALAINFVAKAGEQYAVDGIVLDAAFISYGTIARHVTSKSIFGWFAYPFTILVPSTWDPKNIVSEIKVPVMIMHSKDDRVIPYDHGVEIYEQMIKRGNNRVCWLESHGGHIASFSFEDIRRQTLDFILRQECSE